jgi:hypothetical protein
MSGHDITSHFWVGGPPFFSSSLLVSGGARGSEGETIVASCRLFDVEGAPVNTFQVEFPSSEAGLIELEPFMTGLKMQGGIPQGHLVVTSAAGTRHFCRQQSGQCPQVVSSPALIGGREHSFIPIVLGAAREHLLLFVNASTEVSQVVVRLFYGSRSPEWTVSIPAYGCSAVSLEDELLRSFNDTSWQKGAVQGYVRLSPRVQSNVACQILERIPGETAESEQYRCLPAW